MIDLVQYTLDDALTKIKAIQRMAEALIDDTEKGENIVCNSDDPEQFFLRGQYIGIIDHLNDAVRLSKYIQQPIAYQGILEKNENARYEVDGLELTSGSACEIFYKGDWYHTSIEHSGDYYAVLLGKDTRIDGLKARVRSRY